MFGKVLVANRGEIALRIIRALQELGIVAVAVYSEADRAAQHVRQADEAYPIGPAAPRESYLSVPALLEACRLSGAEALHPGYGFLSENAEFARACGEAGVVFIGPSPEVIATMGEKTAARRLVESLGVPVLPGLYLDEGGGDETLQARAEALGFPLVLKAAFGGGGKGMRWVHRPDELHAAFERARSEARQAFGDGTLYLEKALVRPRHIEIQIVADRQGNVLSLLDRDCSLQRRHQKVVEEAPAAALSREVVETMSACAERIAKAAGYYSLGTLEFLVDEDENFYFLEMNTRLQVEHPVTELVYGIDLVHEQIRIAAGLPLSLRAEQVQARGHAVECRIYAEDPEQNFMPSPGTLQRYRPATGPWLRVDDGVYEGYEIPSEYDPLLAKLVAWGRDRDEALSRMKAALSRYVVLGVANNLEFLQRLLSHPTFVNAQHHTSFIESERASLCAAPLAESDSALPLKDAVALIAAALWRETKGVPAVSASSTSSEPSAWRRTTLVR